MAAETVLIADDEKVIRDGCTRIFTSEGYRVLTAANGREALELLDSGTPDVFLCDLQMPVMGVFEVIEGVRARHPELPLIVITGHATVANAVECMKKGAYDFITKPFRADHLVWVVKRALERQALERRAHELQEAQAKNLYDLATEKSRIRTIVNCMADAVLVTNRELEVVLHNPALTRLLGLEASPGEARPLGDLLGSHGLLGRLRAMVERVDAEPELLAEEVQKGRRYLRALSAPIPGPNQEVVGSVTVFHDITGFKELDAMKSHFVHMVAHELRSPLSAVKQQIAVILEGLAGEVTAKQHDLLSRSKAKLQNLIELINDLLDVAKIESGGAVQQQVPLRIEAILEGVMQLLHPKAESQCVTLRLELPEALPAVQADPRGMEEVFTNLISNAINYSPDGGTVTLSARPSSGFLEVAVSDTGIGIDPGEIEKIFDKFYRVKDPRTRQVVGTGLGLAIVKGIVEAHRGFVEVDSTPGAGTTFRVLLPAAQEC